MAKISKEKRDKILQQAINEIVFARTYRQGKIFNWQMNEILYYGKKKPTEDSRANVDLGRMQEFVHTLLSKIDNPLTFKFLKRKESQLKRVDRLNSLKNYDTNRDDWDMKDLAGKKQAIIYGRAIYAYYADSHTDAGYCPHLEPIDVYDFLIDPAAGGIDIERAMNLGRYGVVKKKSDLRKGIRDGIYLRTETENLINLGGGNADESTQEKTNQSSRTYDQNVTTSQKEMSNKDKYVFWEWYTTYEGERYYLLMQEQGNTVIRIERLSDIFESDLWPFWTWAAFIDLTEFWTPSYADYVREPFMAQAVTINQMLDNAEQINKPQKVVDVNAIEDLASLKYRKEGLIKVKGSIDVNRAIQYLRPQPIDTPLKVYDKLESIQEKSSGVTAASKGEAEEDKVGIYEGNAANTADRFGLLNKSYAFGYKRFAKLYLCGVKEHLTKKISIDILGPNGVEVQDVSKRDLFRKDEEFGVLVEASNAELALSVADRRAKVTFLQSNMMNPAMNKQKAFEMQASIVGFSEEDVRQLMDVSEFGDAGLMAEAERDIEMILDGKPIKPNRAATTAYKQRFVDYMMDNAENINMDQFRDLADYVLKLEPIIIENMNRMINQNAQKMASAMTALPPGSAPPGAEPKMEENFNINEKANVPGF